MRRTGAVRRTAIRATGKNMVRASAAPINAMRIADAMPRAMQAASEYTDRMKFGLLGVLGGMVCSIGGVVYAATQTETNNDGGPAELTGRGQAGLYVALGCMVVMIAGAGYLGTAEPYRWDAINIFNDAPPPLPMPTPGAPVPGWSASTKPAPSLNMRE